MNYFAIILMSLFFGVPVWAAPVEGGVETKPVIVASAQVAPAAQAAAIEPLMGFKVWKQKQIFRAKSALDEFKMPQVEIANSNSAELKAPVQDAASQAPTVEEKQEIEKIQTQQAERLRQLEYNLEIAQGLTVHDYFSLYLKKKTKEEMATVIPKLSPEELSALLLAYRKALDGTPLTEKAPKKTLN